MQEKHTHGEDAEAADVRAADEEAAHLLLGCNDGCVCVERPPADDHHPRLLLLHGLPPALAPHLQGDYPSLSSSVTTEKIQLLQNTLS